MLFGLALLLAVSLTVSAVPPQCSSSSTSSDDIADGQSTGGRFVSLVDTFNPAITYLYHSACDRISRPQHTPIYRARMITKSSPAQWTLVALKFTDLPLPCKPIKNGNDDDGGGGGADQALHFASYSKIRHEAHILRASGLYHGTTADKDGHTAIAMEYFDGINGADLFDRSHKDVDAFVLRNLEYCLKQMRDELTDKRIVHRDWKLEHLIFLRQSKEECPIRLIGYRLAAYITDGGLLARAVREDKMQQMLLLQRVALDHGLSDEAVRYRRKFNSLLTGI